MSGSGYSLITGHQAGENSCGLQEKSGEANIVSKVILSVIVPLKEPYGIIICAAGKTDGLLYSVYSQPEPPFYHFIITNILNNDFMLF